MKARIPKHREFIINFPDSIDQNKANEGWAKLQQIVEDYKKPTTALLFTLPPSSRTASPRSRSCRKSTALSTPWSSFSKFSIA